MTGDYMPTSRYSMLGAEQKIAALEAERDTLAKRVEELETLLGDCGDAEAAFSAFLLTAHAQYPTTHPDYYREQSKVAEKRCAVWSEQRRIATRRAGRASS